MTKRREFGELELQVLDIIKQKGRANVQDVVDVLGAAYTTVMTVMSRLANKGELVREKVGRLYEYAIGKKKRKISSVMVSYLIDELDGVSEEDLKLLEEKIQQLRGKDG